jgi:ABC-2 type transport system permease protein
MIQTQLALLRRELWEHRAIYVVPGVVALLMVLSSLTGQVSINNIEHLDAGIIGIQNMPDNARSAALSALMVGLSTPFIFAMWVLTIFYCLDSLYAERKDRSILFWRSIPVTDFETVLSKLLTAVIVVPLVTFAIVVATQLLVLINVSIWVNIRGGSPGHLIWAAMPFADNWTAMLMLLIALPLWMSPFVGWFLFVSAFTKRSPLLVAALPIVLLPILEKLFFGSAVTADAFFVRSIKMPLFANIDNMELLFQEGEDIARLADAELSLIGLMDVGGFLANPQLWLGLVVCGLFTAAAVYVRRYRDDS